MEKQQAGATVFLLSVTVAVAAAASTAGETVRAEFQLPGENPVVSLEVADTPRERKKGLMFRRSLQNGTGMLFVFQEEKRRAFWMKNTYIPLDIIYLDAEKEVVDIDQADPQPGVPDRKLERYWSDSPAKYVIEVRQGFSARQGLEEGAEASFELHR
ncbi:MAG: DUF192 domain-containing protein [Candidatus Nanohaloarchaea archaeon]